MVIGLPDKDLFNASEPVNDVDNFGAYVLYPTLPVLINALFNANGELAGEAGVSVAPATPRNDLLAAFVTGVDGLNKPANGAAGEILRLNTAIAVTPAAMQSDLGFLGCDLAGFPNGRRPLEDVTDIALNVVMGAIDGTNAVGLQTCDVAAEGGPAIVPGPVINDGALFTIDDFLPGFPYLNHPTPGAPAPAQ